MSLLEVVFASIGGWWGGGLGAGRLGLDLTGQQGVNGVQPVVEVPVTSSLDQEPAVSSYDAENRGLNKMV